MLSFTVVLVYYVCHVLLLRIETNVDMQVVTDNVIFSDGSYMAQTIGTVSGVLMLSLFFRKRIHVKDIFVSSKKMTIIKFMGLLCVFVSGQFFFDFISYGIEFVLNVYGVSALKSIDMATAGSDSIGMFIYVSIVAPICEELIYRGFCLRILQKFGKLYAVVLSALLFGVMHANLPQGFFAFYMGLILGYVAIEYSIGYSIVLHFINNCVFGDLFSILIMQLPENVQKITFYFVFGIFAIIAVIIVIMRRKKIADFVSENRTRRGTVAATITAFGFFVFTASNMIIALSLLEPV